MLFNFPPETFVVATSDYNRPYDNPIDVKAGDFIMPVTDGSVDTDIMGWTWCVGRDGRAGWTPNSWCQPIGEGWQISRDFSALEFTLSKGDRLRLLFSESGFLFCEADSGERAWVPDAVMTLAT
ncbi:SH3 domain-containing protein [Ochrobactrum sp. BTU1]|uniref:SH3 domain-containing protein n=1 Tax=Ochrobactrum sp. BTU1 TaxID=2840456 RepID=UPI001C05C8DB|nr:hypothetical protein KMS41_22395 [Ochrobactrum sp. BTU1]